MAGFAQRQLSRLVLANGYNKNRDIYTKNARLQTVTITGQAGKQRSFRLADTGDWQEINLDWLGETNWLSIVISDVYRGSKYSDTAISELRVE